MTRLIIVFIAIWDFAAGLALVAFQGAGSGALGAGLTDTAAQRLLGAHLLVLASVYLLLAWRTERYQGLLWLPFVMQLAVLLSVAYSIFVGDSRFEDSILALVISALFAGLYGFVWLGEQRSAAAAQMQPGPAAEPTASVPDEPAGPTEQPQDRP